MKKRNTLLLVVIFLLLSTACMTISNTVNNSLPESNLPTDEPLPKVTETPQATPTVFGGGSGKIAFVSDRGGNFNLYVLDIQSGNLEQITNDAGHDYSPSWSPDGTQLAYRYTYDDRSSIWRVDADGGNLY